MRIQNIGAFVIATIAGVFVEPGFATLQNMEQYWFGIGVRDSIILPSGSSVDAYNYSPGDKVIVRTNSTAVGAITLNYGVTVHGDVVVGPGGDPLAVIANLGAVITGDVYAAPDVIPFSSVTVPAYLTGLPSMGTINNSTTITTSGKYDSIHLTNGEFLMIRGPVALYVTGDVLLGNSTEILIDNRVPDSSLTLYLGGNLEGKNAIGFNNLTLSAERLQIFGLDSCTSIVFRQSSDLYAAVYSPQAALTISNSANIIGAVAAGSFQLKNSAVFYYDASIPEPATLVLLGLGGLLLRWPTLSPK